MEMPTPSARVLALKPRVVQRLEEVLPKARVIHDLAETRAYECDALTAYRCPPMAAVLPETTEGRAAIVTPSRQYPLGMTMPLSRRSTRSTTPGRGGNVFMSASATRQDSVA